MILCLLSGSLTCFQVCENFESMKKLILTTICLFQGSWSLSQSEGPYREGQTIEGHLAKPAQVHFAEADIKKLKVPAGFKIQFFAKDIDNARMMATDSTGALYVSRPKSGDILKLQDTDGDGVMDQKEVFVSGYERPHGMAIEGDFLYFVSLTKIFKVSLKDKKQIKLVVDQLPGVGQHENRSLAIGPDHLLYVAIAANCNACVDPNKKMATMQRMKLDGSGMETFAEGLRDTIGFDWQPNSAELYGMDHGRDWLGDEIPREEFNHLVFGKNYGWPFCWNDKKVDVNFIDNPEKDSKEDFCRKSEAPALTYAAHAAPLALKFYNGKMFPEDYRGSAFVAFHGSWNRKKPSGYLVARIVFKGNQPDHFEDFMTGFLSKDGRSQFGRPAGLLVMNDGSLLVSDDSSGVIYRISH